jgi:response regulator RpfG family c-di-GMP phosphodiesterase
LEQAGNNGKKVLIVDDDENHVTLLKKRLQAAGYETYEAGDGIEGLKQAVHQRPDLIIADVLLPRMNGFQLVEQLKSNSETNNIPIIMMSAVYVTEEDMARGFELGAETYVSKADLALRKPLQEEALLDAAASLLSREEPETEAAPARVLVVDDEPDIIRLITKRLKPEGYELDVAVDGEEALEKTFSTPVDLVLLDIRLPEVDGLTVLSQIKERHPGIAVVMMTAYGSEQVAMEALRRGADDYLIKPLDEDEPLPTVKMNLEKLRRRQQMDEIAGRLRRASSPDLEEKERLIEELRQSSITLMDQYDRLLAAEEQNRAYAERLEQMVEERTRDLERRSQELEAMHSVLSAATRSLDMGEVMDITLAEVGDLLFAQATAAFLVDYESDRLRLIAQHEFPSEFLRWVSSIPGGEGIFAEVLASGKGSIVADLSEDANLASMLDLDPQSASLVVFPIKSPTQVVGLIAGTCPREKKIDYDGWRLLNSIGEEIGVVVENIRLYDNLRQAYLSTIRALAEAIDARDSYTKGHSENVSTLAVGIGRQMGLDDEVLTDLRDAGYLHDVGKIGTPDAVLMKEGILTPEEMETMRRHPGTSHRILSHAHLTDGVKDMIRHHHERFDGKGYPDSLKGERIPIGSRILAVADAYEAMVSDRPYRSRLTDGEALAELSRCAGSQFDPEVVEAFLAARKAGGAGGGIAAGTVVGSAGGSEGEEGAGDSDSGAGKGDGESGADDSEGGPKSEMAQKE